MIRQEMRHNYRTVGHKIFKFCVTLPPVYDAYREIAQLKGHRSGVHSIRPTGSREPWPPDAAKGVLVLAQKWLGA